MITITMNEVAGTKNVTTITNYYVTPEQLSNKVNELAFYAKERGTHIKLARRDSGLLLIDQKETQNHKDYITSMNNR